MSKKDDTGTFYPDGSGDDAPDNVEIFSTEDERIKSFGELLTNDSSRAILQILLTDEQSASQLALKTDLSLPLVVYHLNKMQKLDVIKVSRIEPNVKGQDMKYYRATKFAIVILPSTVSERAKGSKSLLRSFKTIYRFAGIGIAGVAAWLGSAALYDPTPAKDLPFTSGETAGGPYQGTTTSEDAGHATLEESLEPATRQDSAKALPPDDAGPESTAQYPDAAPSSDAPQSAGLLDTDAESAAIVPSEDESPALDEKYTEYSSRPDEPSRVTESGDANIIETGDSSGLVDVAFGAQTSALMADGIIIQIALTAAVVGAGLLLEMAYRVWSRKKTTSESVQSRPSRP